MSEMRLNGLIAATVTPLDPAGAIDLTAIEPMIDRLIESGVTGLYVCGSTGEGMSLTCQERKNVVEASVAAADGRVPVIVQVGHNSITDACDLANHAVDVGANVVSATCPSYFKVADTETLLKCMGQIANAAPQLPFYYYHIPALTGSQIDVVDFLERGGKRIPNLAGLKYTNTLIHEFQACRNTESRNFDVVWGCDEMLLAAFASGAAAAIGSTYNIAAPLYCRIIEAIEAGDWKTARQLQYHSVAMVNVMKSFPFHAALKAIMAMLGIPVGSCRLPLNELTEKERVSLQSELDRIGFFDWCGHETQFGS
ncbi:MAG TPA: N-acetylneuraminate lyase [Rhodopirellula sp.]|nr:MAG: N-acetylneuraminate lyase [Saprospirales bacterium TMED214]HBV61555.1 N-acetylneuraminate lyase [Rhodopirellula sp.]